MEIQEVLQQAPHQVVAFFRSLAKDIEHETYAKQYDPAEHDIHDTVLRPDKIVKPDKDTTTSKPVARLSMPFQKLIVDRAAAFLVGDGLKLVADPGSDADAAMYEAVVKAWHDAKCDYKTRQMARTWMSSTEVAEYWYIDKKPQLRMQVWSYSSGDSLYPYFDEFGDMQAFGRGYKIDTTNYLDVWTADTVQGYQSKSDNWELVTDGPNLLGKIPVVYYHRDETEWADVQPLIDRYEKMISNFADANDYFASPLVFVKGQITGFAEKGEQGKMITGEEGADVRYITWDQAPEAIRLEKETLQELIYTMTQTPDISFQQMKGLGASVSGVALKLMFLDAALKSLRHQEEFGEGGQRRINIMKQAVMLIDPSIKSELRIMPEFVFYMPGNDEELIRTLVSGTGGRAVMSRKTAIENNPFVLNAEKEMEDLKADEAGDFGNIMP